MRIGYQKIKDFFFVVLARMAAMPNLPCVLDKHWQHGEWHHLPGAGTVCVTGLPEGAGSLSMSSGVLICLCLNPETEKCSPKKRIVLAALEAGIAFCHLMHHDRLSPILIPPKHCTHGLSFGLARDFQRQGSNIWLTASGRAKPCKRESLHRVAAIHALPLSPAGSAAQL